MMYAVVGLRGSRKSMTKDSIKGHLNPYSISKKRKTTINHAFASAIAPVDLYDDVRTKLDEALRSLELDPEGDLRCVYCGEDAETWDHLVGLVKDGELRGYGHQLGNLVPCCKKCNSRKGSKNWDVFLEETVPNEQALLKKLKLIKDYHDNYATRVEPDCLDKELRDDIKRYRAIREEIFERMNEADKIAERIRNAATVKK
jgi:hypothetical protein